MLLLMAVVWLLSGSIVALVVGTAIRLAEQRK
jgi:hypothetical protein